MNGRTLGDSSGHCTSFQYNGKSTIDYVISGENLIHLIPTLSVSSPTHVSDHAYITFTMTMHRIDAQNHEEIQARSQTKSLQK